MPRHIKVAGGATLEAARRLCQDAEKPHPTVQQGAHAVQGARPQPPARSTRRFCRGDWTRVSLRRISSRVRRGARGGRRLRPWGAAAAAAPVWRPATYRALCGRTFAALAAARAVRCGAARRAGATAAAARDVANMVLTRRGRAHARALSTAGRQVAPRTSTTAWTPFCLPRATQRAMQQLRRGGRTCFTSVLSQ